MTAAGRCMVVSEELLFAYSFYVFAFRFLPGADFKQYDTLQIALGFVYVFLLLLCQSSFWRASNTDPGYVTEKFIEEHILEVDKYFESATTERKHNGEMRRCNKCKKAKPDRAHHCSICNKCVLKMDHHCPFINNCIGFFNYKFFFIFLFWNISFCFFVIGCMSFHGYYLFTTCDKYVDYFEVVAAFLCFICTFFLSILFSTHIRFICQNLTTIEHVEKRTSSKNPYNLGFRKNFVTVFGSNPFLWFLPIWTSQGDGVRFPNNNETSSLLTHT